MPGKRFSQAQQEALAGLLRRIRSESGLTQVQLAEKLDQPQSYVSKLEAGERRLDILELRELCTAVGISLGVFVEQLEKALAGRRRGNA